MAEVPDTPVPPEKSQREILALLEEIRRQNINLKRYICVLGGGLTLMLLMQSEMIQTVVHYAIIVLLVMVIMLTAPVWSQIVVGITDRIPWYPKRKQDRPDSPANSN